MPRAHDAIPYIAKFSLDLFCDQLHDPRVEASFTGRTFSGCCVKARRAGWRIHYDTKTATCPSCVKAMRLKVRKLAQDRRREMRKAARWRSRARALT